MDELISKRAVIEAIEKARANVGHNLERSIGKSIIEILDDVGEDVGKLPSALGTNLAEVGTDTISRQVAISAICSACGKIDCDKMDKCEKLQLPPVNSSEIPNSSDTISRQMAIDVVVFECGEWMGLAREISKQLRQMPSAQPEIIRCRNCKFASGDSRICMQFGHSPIGELDFCAWAERRTDE